MFGNGAFQISAGESFVICNYAESKICKLPFSEGKSTALVLSREVATWNEVCWHTSVQYIQIDVTSNIKNPSQKSYKNLWMIIWHCERN